MTADHLPRTSPLDGWSARFAALPDGVQIAEEPFVAMTDLRLDVAMADLRPDVAMTDLRPDVAMAGLRPDVDGPAAAGVARSLGIDALPTAPGWVAGDTATITWLGPDEWLVTSTLQASEDLEAGLGAALDGAGNGWAGTVVDVSAQYTTLTLHGAHVRDVLAAGCALDLHPRVFGAGSAAATTVGGAGVLLLALDHTGTRYQLVVRASYARHLAAWLLDAATEYGKGS